MSALRWVMTRLLPKSWMQGLTWWDEQDKAAEAEREAAERAAYEPAMAAIERAEEAERQQAVLQALRAERERRRAECAQKLADEVADLDAFATAGTRFVYLGIELVALGVAHHTGEAVMVAEHVVDGSIVEARFGWDHLPALRSERWRAQAEKDASETFGDLPRDWREPHD